MMFTSSFNNIGSIPNWYVPVAISRYVPKGYDGIRYEKLAPTEEILNKYKNNEITEEEYTELYKNQVLSKLDPSDVYLDLMYIADSINIVLLCYESPKQFCHRHILAEWLNKNLQTNVREFCFNNECL